MGRRGRPYWEENGFTSEWYWHQHQMRRAHLPVDELIRIIDRHGDVARAEFIMLTRSGNYASYAAAEAQVLIRLKAPGRTDGIGGFKQTDLFGMVAS